MNLSQFYKNLEIIGFDLPKDMLKVLHIYCIYMYVCIYAYMCGEIVVVTKWRNNEDGRK